MPAKVDVYWEGRVKSIKGKHQHWGAGRTYQELKQEAEKSGREDYPSERWVGKYLREGWDELTEGQKQRYALLSWPGSMEDGALPWEASAADLELLAYLNDLHSSRPNHEEALWFWRVTQAAPDAPLDLRYDLSTILATRPLMGYPVPEGLESVLAHAGPYRQTNQGGHIRPIEDLENFVKGWLRISDIEGYVPDTAG
jgi:hypothetical protein